MLTKQVTKSGLASRRQPIILSSDDNRSLRIIVCYHRWGRNRCWAIRMLYGLKRQNNGLICNYRSDHVLQAAVSYQSKSRKNTLPLFLQDMADAWRDQWVPVYSQSSNGIHESHLPPIPSTPHTPQFIHRKSSCTSHTILWHSSRPQEHSICRFTSHICIQPHQYKDSGTQHQ